MVGEPLHQDWIALMAAWADTHPGWEIVGYAPAAFRGGRAGGDGVRVQVRRIGRDRVISGVGSDLPAALQDVDRIIQNRR